MSLSFVALDFETANQRRGSVCQIGITRVVDGKIGNVNTRFVTPPPGLREFSWNCVKVHGITASDIVGADDWPTTVGRIIRYAGDLPILAHNASVERSCIEQASAAHGITAPAFRYFCTLQLARAQFPDEQSHSLGTLSNRIGLPAFGHHDAGEDAAACARLLLEIANRRRVTDFTGLSEGWLKVKKQTRRPAFAA